jgi:hypothetical protein
MVFVEPAEALAFPDIDRRETMPATSKNEERKEHALQILE